jgi:hypothetical protein
MEGYEITSKGTVVQMHTMIACREMEIYFHSCLPRHYMDMVFYFHSSTTLSAAREPSGPSIYEDQSAHTGEGLGPFRFDVWIVAYVSDMFFRNVRPHHQFTSQTKESSAIRLWKYLLLIGNPNANSTMSSIYPSICIY